MNTFLKLILVILALGICNCSIGLRINQPSTAQEDYDESLSVILGPRTLKTIHDFTTSIPSHPHGSSQTNEDRYDDLSTVSLEKSKLGEHLIGGKEPNRVDQDDDNEQDRYVIMFKEGRGNDTSNLLSSRLRTKKATKGDRKKRRPHKKVLKLSKKEAKAWSDREDVDYVETDRKVQLLKESKSYGIDFVTALHVDDGKVSNRKVCILDSGYDYKHPDLPNGSGITGESESSDHPWDQDDWTSHGTHVAGIITSVGGNNIGTVGVIRNGTLQLHIVRIFRNKNWIWGSDLISAVEACVDAGANIVNMSLGGVGYKRSEEEAFELMVEEDNLLLIAAAGNDGTTDSFYPASYDSVISVGAINESRKHASFSQKNDQLDLVAPGVNIKSTMKNKRYGYFDGTSMASAYVSGVAALVWSHFPEQSSQDIRDVLFLTALDLGEEGKDEIFGHGLISASRAFSYLNGDECTDIPGWYDSWGQSYDCLWYSFDDNCEVYGHFFENFEMNAQEACCICGGGTFSHDDDDANVSNDDIDFYEHNDDGIDADDEVEFNADDDEEIYNNDDEDEDFSNADDDQDIIQDDDEDEDVSNADDDQDIIQDDDGNRNDICKDASDWFDSWGPSYDCNWYAIENRCHEYGSYFWNMGHTALTACCICKN